MNTPFSLMIFCILAAITLGSAVAAVSLRQAVHCGLSVALTFVGAGLIHIFLGAEFVGYIQLLVYVGAVAVLIMFVILLTRSEEVAQSEKPATPVLRLAGLLSSVGVFALLVWVILGSDALAITATPATAVPIAALGHAMVDAYLLPLFVTAALLTAALIGGVLLAYGKEAHR